MPKRFFSTCLIFSCLLLAACTSATKTANLDETLLQYAKYIRWSQFDEIDSHTRMSGRFKAGAGADYYITEKIALTASVAYAAGGGTAHFLKATEFVGGVMYRW